MRITQASSGRPDFRIALKQNKADCEADGFNLENLLEKILMSPLEDHFTFRDSNYSNTIIYNDTYKKQNDSEKVFSIGYLQKTPVSENKISIRLNFYIQRQHGSRIRFAHLL